MFLGKVVGSVVSVHKDESLIGLKLLIVQPMRNRTTAKGKPIVAIDLVGVCGRGDLVYLTKGREAGLPLGKEMVAADAGIMGVVETFGTGKEET